MEKHEFVMKVTAYGKTVTIAQVEDAVDIHEFLDMCRALAIGIGYHEESWEDAVTQMAGEYTTDTETLTNDMLNKALGGNYPEPTNKVYTGKSDLITHWGKVDTPDC